METRGIQGGSAQNVEAWQFFRHALPLQVQLHEIVRAVGSTDGETCLDVGMPSGVMSHHLRQHGGEWHSVVRSEEAAEAAREVLDGNVAVSAGDMLPFENKSFDAVVVAGWLEMVQSDEAFIEECHRVLKPDGRLVLNVAHVKAFTLLRPLRNMLGLKPERLGLKRAGYTESELFNILKNGFNVHQMRSYSRFGLEFVDAFVQSAVQRTRARGRSGAQLKRLYAMAGVLYRIAYQLDLLLFLGRGHHLIAVAKRRTWRPRKAPVLVDGRSISEAVLSRASQ